MDDQKLKEYFKFDEGDLNANRNGYFSQGQNKRLNSRQGGAIRQKRIAVVITFPLALILLGWLAYLIYTGMADVGAIILLGLFGGVLLWASIYIFRLSLIRQKYLLKKAEGPINIIKETHTVEGHPYHHYELHVGGETFKAASDVGNMMMQGDTYAVYYAEGSISNLKEILSVERLSKAG